MVNGAVIDVDLTSTYSKVLVFAPATGLLLNVDPVGYELDAANKTRNLRTAARGQFVMPSAKVGAKSYVTGDFVLGYEAGRQQKLGDVPVEQNIWRTVMGANGYALIQGGPVVKRIDLTASWIVRLLSQNEPLTSLKDGASVSVSNDEARHLFTASGVFMINKGLGFSVGYRHGSEPPTYKYVKHRGEVGMVVKLKQINKG